jgi:hypothetical protein
MTEKGALVPLTPNILGERNGYFCNSTIIITMKKKSRQDQ